MNSYTERLMLDSVNHNFHFTKINGNIHHKYFIEVFRINTSLASFDMKELDPGNWKIQTDAPAWILKIEDRLSDILIRIDHDD